MLLRSKPSEAERRLAGVGPTDRPIRSLAKAISWRITGSLDTIFLSWLFTNDLSIAAAIGLTEVLTKMVLYYLHERVWNRVPLGRGVAKSEHATQPAPERREQRAANAA